MNRMKMQNDKILKGEFPGSVGAQYKTEPKQKQYPVVDVTGDGSKV